MRMAKAPEEQVDKLRNWLKFNDELCKIDPTDEHEWENFKSDWSDDEDFSHIIDNCGDEDGFNWEYYFNYYRSYISHIHFRILFGYKVLIDNCCDPELDYLEFNKEIKEALEKSK